MFSQIVFFNTSGRPGSEAPLFKRRSEVVKRTSKPRKRGEDPPAYEQNTGGRRPGGIGSHTLGKAGLFFKQAPLKTLENRIGRAVDLVWKRHQVVWTARMR